MSHRISYRPVLLALAATLFVAGLFYLPCLVVCSRNMTMFHDRQLLLAQQAAVELQTVLTTYENALLFLSRQPLIRYPDEGSAALLRDFHAAYPQDLRATFRFDGSGVPLFTFPETASALTTAAIQCRRMCSPNLSGVGVSLSLDRTPPELALFVPIVQGQHCNGCLAFAVPCDRMIERALESIVLPQGGYAMLLSQSGRILHAPDTALVGAGYEALIGEADELARLGEVVSLARDTLIKLTRSPMPRDSAARKTVYVLLHPVRLFDGGIWSIALVTPADEVWGALAGFHLPWLLVTSGLVIVVGLLAFLRCNANAVAGQREQQQEQILEEQMAGLLERVPMGVVVLDPRQMVLAANLEAMSLISGNLDQHLIGKPFASFLHQECRESVLRRITGMEPGQTVTIDHALLHAPSCSQRDVAMIVACSVSDMHQHCMILIRDTTEERQALAWQRRLATTVDQVREAVLIAMADGTIEYVNRAMAEMTGYSRGECSGRPARLLWAGEQDTHFERNMAAVIERGEAWQGRIVNQRKDRTLFVAAATVSPLRNTQGIISHFVLVQRDITHEVEIDTRMRQTQKMEAIGTLAGGIAHDFNNILGGIIGFTDMALLKASPGSALQSNLLHIRQGGKRAADLVQQILTFSRQSVEERSPIALVPVIQESLKLMRATLPATIEIIQDLTATTAKVVAAPVQIQQIVMNLCANAFYAMKEQGGHLTIRFREQTGAELEKTGAMDSSWAVLTVEDTGQGMEREVLQRIFTPFFTTKQPGEGTGMGLSVVHGIVRELSGEISVCSEPGKGTVFTVLLPITEHDGNSPLLSGEEPLCKGTGHILVVDDEQEIRETCKMMLGHLGYTITTSAVPLEVLDLIDRAKPPIDLVITDHTMPKMTGLELTTAIRRLHPHIPVLLCTGYSDRLDDNIAREAGACDLLMKPIDLRGLSVAVHLALNSNPEPHNR